MIRVMIVDDHAIVRKGIRALLTESGDFEIVAEAADGQEAVLRADGNPARRHPDGPADAWHGRHRGDTADHQPSAGDTPPCPDQFCCG